MSNKIKFENISKFVEYEEKISIPKYTISDFIFWLLSSQNTPIFGKISFFKEMFLMYKEVLPIELKNKSINPKFIDYTYGPYSFLIADVLEQLKYDGYVSVEGRKNSRTEKFSLTNEGKKEAEKRIELLSDKKCKQFSQELKNRRRTWDQLGNRGLLNYVYKNYPEYTKNSRIKYKISYDIWDEGRIG